MRITIPELVAKAKLSFKENKKFLERINRKPPKNLDNIAFELHQKYSKEFDCLECGNCCKSISPAMTDKDIERMSKHLRIKPSLLVEKNMHQDADGDFVFNIAPCPFLESDNCCNIYDARPKACSEYPHTDRKKFEKIFKLTLENTFVCPIVFHLVEDLRNMSLPNS